MTQVATVTKKPFLEKRIKDIYDLKDLHKFVCMKVKNHKEWYMECMDNCPGIKTCPVGQQAVVIMEKETKPKEDCPKETDPLRIEIVNIFSNADPIKVLLKSYSNLRPPSLYAKVNSWRRKNPDLEDRYHMVEKVRFLWRKQYESMTITDILKSLYPEESCIDVDVASIHPTSILSSEPFGKYSDETKARIEEKKMNETRTEIAPNSPVITLKPKPNSESDEDSISLEDFLAETSVEHEDIPEEKPKPFQTPNLDYLLNKLQSEKQSYVDKIAEIDEQIDAILTVKKLLNATEQKG